MTDLAWDQAGAGPPLILIHGFSLDRRMWDRQIAPLAARHRVVRYDLRGFGASPLPAGPYDPAADLAALLDHLEIDAAVICGLSLGANVALAFALQHPARARALVLASPGLPGHRWTTPRPPEAAAAHARDHGIAAGKRFWLGHPMFASLDDHPRARAQVHAMVQDYSGWHWANPDPMVPQAGLADALPRIAVPALVLSGGRDNPGYREIARRIAAEMPQARLEVLPEAGHMINLEAAETFDRLLLQFAAAPFPSEAP